MLNAVLRQFLTNIKRNLLIFFGSLSWLLTMVKSGWQVGSLGTHGAGMGFWGANGHDGVWHIALAESLSRGSFEMPVYAGEKLQNYHIGFDLILALIHRITTIPLVNLYFQVIPVFLAIGVGLLTYNFVLKWTKSENAAFMSTFFVYFGGSFGWLLGKGESAFWSQQAISTLINPPFALSLVIILAGLLCLQILESKFRYNLFIFNALLFGSLIEIKAYAGVLVLSGLFVASIFELYVNKKTLVLKLFSASLVLSLVLYIPLNLGASALMVFEPFWFLETLMGLPDRLNWERFYSAMINYKESRNWVKLIPAYVIAFTVFWLGNFGTRIIGNSIFVKWLKNWRKLNTTEIIIITVTLMGGLLPVFFLQKGTPWNTIQFFYYSLFFLAILSGITLSSLKNRLLVITILLITVPTSIISLRDIYLPSRPPAMLGSEELKALDFLSRQPQGTVLTRPYDELKAKSAEENPPRPLSLYTSTAYISAFSKHTTFLEDEINLEIMDYDWKNRKLMVTSWYEEEDIDTKRRFLRDNNIKYIYWIKEEESPLDIGRLTLVNIYENDLVTIYKVE